MIEEIDKGRSRVAYYDGEKWVVNEWVKQVS